MRLMGFPFFSPAYPEYPLNWDAWRRWVYQRAGYRCQVCGRWGLRLHAHHIVPVSRGGPTTPENLMALCEECHGRVHPHMRRGQFHPWHKHSPQAGFSSLWRRQQPYPDYYYPTYQYPQPLSQWGRTIPRSHYDVAYHSMPLAAKLALGPFAPEI